MTRATYYERRISVIDRLRKRYNELEGDVLIVPITRKRVTKSLGITLCGSNDAGVTGVYVASVDKSSPVGRKNLLKVGDRILEVNGVDLTGVSHLNASIVIGKQASPKLKFVVLRSLDGTNSSLTIPPYRFPSKQEALPNDDYYEFHEQNDEAELAEGEVAIIKGPGDEDLLKLLSDGAPNGSRLVHLKNIKQVGLGFTLKEVKGDKIGAAVRSVDIKGAAPEEGSLRPGDRIIEINDKIIDGLPIAEAEAILRQHAENDTMTLTVSGAMENTRPALAIMGGEMSADGKKSGVKFAGDKSSSSTSQEIEVSLTRGSTGLGISIVGGSDTVLRSVIVQEIHEQGSAATDGRLFGGDILLSINNTYDLKTATHDEAVKYLREAGDHVTLRVLRPVQSDSPLPNEESMYDTIQVELNKKPGKGLGLSIVGRRWRNKGVLKNSGIFIKEVVPKSAAFQDGRLRRDDQILSVNGVDLRDASQEQAATFLKAVMGKVSIVVRRFKEVKNTISSSQSEHALARNGEKRGIGRKDVAYFESAQILNVHHAFSSLACDYAPSVSPVVQTLSTALPRSSPVLHTVDRDRVTNCGSQPLVGRLLQSPSHAQPQFPVTSPTGNNKAECSPVAMATEPASNRLMTRIVKLERNAGEPFGLNIGVSENGTLTIIALFANLPASRCGKLHVGDVITKVNDSKIDMTTHSQLLRLLKTAKCITLELVGNDWQTPPTSIELLPKTNASTGSDNDAIAIATSGKEESGGGKQVNESPHKDTNCNSNVDQESILEKRSVVEVTLDRTSDGLGFSIVGGRGSEHGNLPIYIRTIYEAGPAALDGRLKKGDEIISVNDVDFSNLTHDEAVHLLRLAEGRVRLKVLRLD